MSRPRRLNHHRYRGCQRYFVTFCVKNRRPVFTCDRLAVAATQAVLRTAVAESFAVLAYCVLPDHVHLLVEGQQCESDLPRFVKMAKQRAWVAAARERGGPLWQEGYFERVLRNTERTEAVVRYIVENPVRAGLVRSPGDYPHLGSSVWKRNALLDVV